MKLSIRRLTNGEGLPLPAYASDGAAGLDLYAALPAGQKLVLEPGARDLIPTGVQIALPAGFEAQLRPRSGLAVEFGVTVLNAPGTIDSDYRGEVKALLINHGGQPFEITRGMRIAQLVIAPVAHAALVECEELEETARGAGGFGSTGLGERGE
ncbi:dUTP diphosphatase [Methylocystis echinoides]|jgi:dUTP pyrophosphatase|uniref:dUTP diphosphatase n=1 Tax=Methylocystis echinoides TaxID=29468 RepID=UPI0034432A4D